MMRHSRFGKALLLAGVVFLGACSKSKDLGNDQVHALRKELPNQVVLDWNVTAVDAMGGITYQHSLLASRINAMMHIAMHDALNSIQRRYETYAFFEMKPQADEIAAAASAAYEVLVAQLPESKPLLDAQLQASLADVKDNPLKAEGLALGKKAAAAILQRRANDGAFENPIGQVPVSDVPGVYQAVPPFDFIFAPHWKTMQLFALQSHDQFRPAPPPALGSAAYAQALNEVKTQGNKASATRTLDQTRYAQFWYEFSEIGWNRVTREVARQQELDLYRTARLFALVNMAMADSYTAGWDAKMYYNLWRPYTAIRKASIDGNDATQEDVQWEPLMPTPPVQDYPSTHSVLGNAAATVLTKELGNTVTFTMTSSTAVPAGSVRGFRNFMEAANENADSRVQAGIHFRFASDAGQQQGSKIGEWVFNQTLKKIR